MEWVKNFYNLQYKWMTIDDEECFMVQENLLDELEAILVERPFKNILELGGGKGHFAVTAARRGYEVTVIELIPEAVVNIHKLANKYNLSENPRVINGDFYTEELIDQFDVVCYWDGFGIGTDFDQQMLLKRIQGWLKPNGNAFVDIYTPWYWAKVAGQEMLVTDNVFRRYDFDSIECRMLDTWTSTKHKCESVSQSLRCYSPADLKLLINGLQLELIHCEPRGAMDYEKWIYREKVPLNQAMSYLARIIKK